MPSDDESAALHQRLDTLEMVLALSIENAGAASRALIAALARLEQLENRMAALVAAATARELCAASVGSDPLN